MESEFFNFEPSDFQVLEEIDFDETIQRPEKVRFFTLEEQTVDAFEKMLPKGRLRKHEIKEVQTQVDRLKDLYSQFVTVTVDDYQLREPEYKKKLSWVYPVYSFADEEYTTYDFQTSWVPLYQDTRQPNFYPRMLSSLPKPIPDAPRGTPYEVTVPTETLNANGMFPRRVLPNYEMTRTQRHDDGSISIARIPANATADRLNIEGYYLAKRPLEVPNPLPEHPFLKDSESTFLPTTEPLSEIAPSLDAVMTHAIPVTSDPYGAAQPYLKLYDIRLQDIPWSSWKAKFPSVEAAQQQEPIQIDFPKPQDFAPSDKLIEGYSAVYNKGVSSRKWLMDQVDGGGLVVTMLMSMAIENGSVNMIPGMDIPIPNPPATTLDECQILGKTFQEFVVQGSLRRQGKDLFCVPVELVKQERSRIGYMGRLPWKETTGTDMLKSYLQTLKSMYPIQTLAAKSIPSELIPAKPEAPMRKEVLLIQNDIHRFPEDKVRDIQDILKSGTTTLTNHIFSDSQGSFVMCEHTLAVLSGDLAKDKNKFYETWTSRDDGFRVCKFCGEHVTTLDLVNQAEFDEDGYVINQADAFEEKVFRADVVAGFTTGLRALQPLFQLDNPMDATCYLLLSILHVLPSAEAVEPLLKFARGFNAKQYGNKDSEDIRKLKGISGILLVIILLQTHTPRLLPRRSFGPRPLYLQGYPRDLPEPEEYSIIDTLLMVIRKTFEAYPTSFKGPSQSVIRAILNKPKDVRKNAIVLMDKVFLAEKTIKALFQRAKEEPIPPVEQPRTLLPVLLPAPTEFGKKITFDNQCPSARPILREGQPAKVVQASIQLRKGIRASTGMMDVLPFVSSRIQPSILKKDDIRDLLKKKTTLLKIGDDYHTNILLASRLADMFLLPKPVIPDPTQNKDELRDIGKGILSDVLQQIQSDPVKRTRFEQEKTKDVTLYALLADFKEEKANVNKLRTKERLKIVAELASRSDQERQILGDLLRIGIAPYIITNRDREIFARESEALADASGVDDELLETDAEVGVGNPLDIYDQGDVPVQGIEGGDYGDYTAQPMNDGRDQPQQTLWDNDDMPI